MVKGIKVLAIIPARAGSKSIPGKNTKLLSGVPLIAYSIAAALESRLVNRVIVSTDDKEIAKTAREFGAEAPFIRPAEFAKDKTLDLPVFEHALSWLKNNEGYVPEIVVHLRPTSPFRPQGFIDRAVELLINDKKADCVRAVIPSRQNPYKMWLMSEKYLKPLLKLEGNPEPFNSARQQLPQTYFQTGHIDVIRPEVIFKKKSMSGDRILPIFIDAGFFVDIDTKEDWLEAERQIKQLQLIVRP